jgi:ribosomal protein S3
VPSWKVFKIVAGVLREHLPDDAEVEAVQVSDDQSSTITIWTSTPAEVIGSQGSTAGSIDQALNTSLNADVTFKVQETRDSSDEVDLFDEGQFGDDPSFGGDLPGS